MNYSRLRYKQLLHNMADAAALNGSFLPDLGLFHGQMGMSLFLFHYAASSGSDRYAIRAEQILQNILQNISQETSPYYADGLCGIAVGLLYLSHHDFISADMETAFSDFDSVIHHYLTCHTPSLLELDYGLSGFMRYYAARLRDLPLSSPLRDMICRDVSDMVDKMDGSYASYKLMAELLVSLRTAYELGIQCDKVRRYMEYIGDLTETMFYEDRYFNTVVPYVPWCMLTLAMRQSACRCHLSALLKKSYWMQRVARRIRPSCLSFDDWCIGQILMRKLHPSFTLQNSHGDEMGDKDVDTDYFAACDEAPFSSDDFMRKGMAMLTLSGACTDAWISLVQ
ncbi:MAG: hypothetical protein K6F98_01020 [Bacteroidales bacterium]|nr:hypothetical protein [Bacteroidales bacterium]